MWFLCSDLPRSGGSGGPLPEILSTPGRAARSELEEGRGGERERERGEKNWKNENRGGVKRRGGKRKVGGPKNLKSSSCLVCK